MKPRLLAAALGVVLAIGAEAEALARTGPNPDGRPGPVLVSERRGFSTMATQGVVGAAGTPRSPATASLAPVPRIIDFSPAPLPAGAVQIDSTQYDLQDLGSLGTRLVIGPDGRVHATWEDDFCEYEPNGCPPDTTPLPIPQRGMGYAYRNASGTWINLGKVEQPSIRCSQCSAADEAGGFGTLSVTPGGLAAIAQHMNEDGCDLRGDFYLETSVGGPAWTAYLTPISDYLFPQVVALPNGSFVVLGEAIRVTTGCTHCGVSDFAVSRLAAAGASFVCATGWQCGAWTSVVSTSIFRNGYPGFPCLAAASNGRVGIAVTDFGGNVRLIESSDGTFNGGTITIRNLTNNTDATATASDSTSTQYRPYIHCHLAYNDTTPNVVWSELQARRSGSTLEFYDWRSRIRHWSPDRGITTVKQVASGEADSYDNVDLGLHGPLAGFNTLSVDWPQVGFSADGRETYVVWERFLDAQVDPTADEGLPGICTGTGFGDIMASVTRANETWSAPQNLTSTPTTDERYVSIASRNAGGIAHILFQASATNQAGVVQAQDRGTSGPLLVRRIAYLERALTGSLVAVGARGPAGAPVLRSWPNPARGRVGFQAPVSGPERGGSRAVRVFSVDGRLMARLPLSGEGLAWWDGRDRAGGTAAAGVYLARLEGSRSQPVKFLMLK